MEINLSDENVKRMEWVQTLKTHKDLTLEFLVNHAVGRYYDRKVDAEDYRRIYKKRLRRALGYQGWGCYFCSKAITPADATLDHLTPLSRGGLSEPENLVAACSPCNAEKADMNEEEFKKYRTLHPIKPPDILGLLN